MPKKFRFRMQPLLELKQQQRQHLERKLAQLAVHRNRCRERVEELGHEQSQQVLDKAKQPANAATMIDVAFKYSNWLSHQLAEAEAEYSDASQAWRSVLAEFEARSQEIESLSNVRQREQTEYNKTLEKKAQHDLEDAVLRQWSSSRKSAG